MADTFRVNGNIVAYTSYILTINGIRYQGLTEVSYGHKIETAYAYGMARSGIPLGTTPGKYVPDPLKLKLYQHTAGAIKQDLYDANTDPGAGLSGYRFPILLQYQELNLVSTVIDFRNCRLVTETTSLSEGAEATMTEFEFWPQFLVVNEQPLFRPDFAF